MRDCRRLVVVSASLGLVGLFAVASIGQAQPPIAKPQPPPAATTAAPGAPATAPKPAAAPGSTTTATTPQAVAPAGGSGTTVRPATLATPPAGTPATPAPAPAPALAETSAVSEPTPSPLVLGMPVLPNATFLGSYDAGGAGQRYYLFGTVQAFADVVGYYRTVLRDKGDLVFEFPPTHMFEVGKFKEEQVAFPPGVTVKDYRFAGGAGLPHPRAGAVPAAFATVIQIVPAPALPAARPR